MEAVKKYIRRRNAFWLSGKQVLSHELLPEDHIYRLTEIASFCLWPYASTQILNYDNRLVLLTNVDYVIIRGIPFLATFPKTLKQDIKVIHTE